MTTACHCQTSNYFHGIDTKMCKSNKPSLRVKVKTLQDQDERTFQIHTQWPSSKTEDLNKTKLKTVVPLSVVCVNHNNTCCTCWRWSIDIIFTVGLYKSYQHLYKSYQHFQHIMCLYWFKHRIHQPWNILITKIR